MLYSEFLTGTKAPETRETYEQFLVIERIYMDCETMSKADAYAIWKKSYGKELKARRKRMLDRANSLLCTVEEFDSMPAPDRQRVAIELDKMFWNAFYNRDRSKNAKFIDGRTYTDEYGIAWGVKRIGSNPNGSSRYGLYAVIDGTLCNAHYTAL